MSDVSRWLATLLSRREGGLLALLFVGCAPDATPIQAALGPDPGGGAEVRVFTSTDRGARWALQPGRIAHRLSSLHACTFEGVVWAPSLLEVDHISWFEEAFPSPFVDVLRSTDLNEWTAARIAIDADVRSVIDPACVVGPRGLELWFADVRGSATDPAQGARTSTIWRTHWDGERFGEGDVVYEGPGLVDPAPIYVDGGARLFLNQDGARIVEVVDGALVRVWDGVTVPQAVELGGARWLVAQQPRGPGMFPVVRDLARATDGASTPLPIDGQLRACESPSLTTLGDTWVLLCVDAPPRRR